MQLTVSENKGDSKMSKQLIDLRQILGEDNKPLTKKGEITPQDYGDLARLAPKIKAFFESSEGLRVLQEDWTSEEKLREAHRIVMEREKFLQ